MANYGKCYFHFFAIFVNGFWFRFGKENFQEALRMTNKSEKGLNWQNFKFMVFDAPTHKGTYAERYNLLGTQFLFLDFVVMMS